MGSKLLIGGYITALISLFIGIFALIFSRPIIQKYITTKLRLTPGSQLYDEWLNPSFQIYMNFYLFDLMNGDEFLKGAKPTFKEVGPFVFHEYITKEDLVDNRNYTISYKERRRYEFVPEMSQHNLDYEITSLNMAVVTVISKIRHSPGWMHDAVNLAFDVTGDNSFLVRKPVRDILFGYEDNFLKELKKIVPSLVPSEIVGLFTDRNNTIYANWTIYTGYDDYKKTGAVEKYNHMETLKFWSSPYANMINGSDGSVLSPFLDRYGLIYSFQKDLCRSIYGKPAEKTVKYTDDIELMTFSPDAYFFANVSVNPDNAGFCTPPGNCLAAGLLNLTSCLDGVPIIMTSPHFLFCDPKFEKEVEGITPDESKHSTVVYVEQNTGVLMKANKRIQFNSQLIRDARISCAKDIPEILYPLFWVDENFAYNKTQADHFYAQVTLPLNLVYVGKYLISSIGLLLILASIGFHVYLNKTRSRSVQSIDIPPTINNSDDDERTPLINHTS